MYRSILDSLAEYDAETTALYAALDAAVYSNQSIEIVLADYMKGTPHESISEPIQYGNDRPCSGETGNEQEAPGRLPPWWFGDASGI